MLAYGKHLLSINKASTVYSGSLECLVCSRASMTLSTVVPGIVYKSDGVNLLKEQFYNIPRRGVNYVVEHIQCMKATGFISLNKFDLLLIVNFALYTSSPSILYR